MKKLLLACLSILFLFSLSFSQEEDTVNIHNEKIIKRKSESSDFSFRFRRGDNPFLKINYGLNYFKHAQAKNEFETIGGIQLQIGYFREKSLRPKFIVNQTERFITFRLISENFYNEDSYKGIKVKTNLFGLGQNKNYGYRTKNLSFLLGTGREFNWSFNKFDKNLMGVDTLILGIYDNNVMKFGEAYNSNISIRAFDFVSLDLNYNYGLIFPRHLFLKHIGSLIIEEAVTEILRSFIDKVFKSRPFAGPVVNFVLKSTLAFAFYELKKERMNWPIKTASPLSYDFYNLGLKFSF